MKKIYIKDIKRKRSDNVDDFTNKLFKVKNNRIRPMPFAYKDIKYKKVQCKKGHKSLDDLYIIYKTTFNNIKIKTILLSIKNNILDKGYAYFLYCPSANKWILYRAFIYNDEEISKYHYTYNYDRSDNYYNSSGDGKYSLKKILNYLELESHIK